MNQKFFASLTGKYMRMLALLFVLFGAAQQLSAQSLVAPSVAVEKLQSTVVNNQLIDFKGSETQTGMQYLRLEYFAMVSERLEGGISTQQAIDKSALLVAEKFTTLPNTNVALTNSHVQTIMSETTTLLSN